MLYITSCWLYMHTYIKEIRSATHNPLGYHPFRSPTSGIFTTFGTLKSLRAAIGNREIVALSTLPTFYCWRMVFVSWVHLSVLEVPVSWVVVFVPLSTLAILVLVLVVVWVVAWESVLPNFVLVLDRLERAKI
jgi:hypothetical protein